MKFSASAAEMMEAVAGKEEFDDDANTDVDGMASLW